MFFTKHNLLVIPLSLILLFAKTNAYPSHTHHPTPSPTHTPHQDILNAHNAFRAAVGVPPMAWNETVAAYAQNYANKRREDCKLEHSMGPYGENLAEGYGRMDVPDAVKFWASERPNYDHATNSCVGDECLHYTQVVWRGSVRVGCGSVKCENGWVFVICSYDPPGNIEGQRPY